MWIKIGWCISFSYLAMEVTRVNVYYLKHINESVDIATDTLELMSLPIL